MVFICSVNPLVTSALHNRDSQWFSRNTVPPQTHQNADGHNAWKEKQALKHHQPTQDTYTMKLAKP